MLHEAHLSFLRELVWVYGASCQSVGEGVLSSDSAY